MYLVCQVWQVRTQVLGYSYTHLASLGVLIWTVARNSQWYRRTTSAQVVRRPWDIEPAASYRTQVHTQIRLYGARWVPTAR